VRRVSFPLPCGCVGVAVLKFRLGAERDHHVGSVKGSREPPLLPFRFEEGAMSRRGAICLLVWGFWVALAACNLGKTGDGPAAMRAATGTPGPAATPTLALSAQLPPPVAEGAGAASHPSAVPSPAPTPTLGDAKWAFWVSGTRLRGADIYQRRVFPDLDGRTFLGPGPLGPPYTQADFDALAAEGANWVDLSVPGLFTVQPPYRPDPAVVEGVDRLIAMAARAGLRVVLSARTGPGRSEFSILREGAGDWFPSSYLVESV